MAEWFKAHAWKVCVLSKVPRVRIPVSPPSIQAFFKKNSLIYLVASLYVLSLLKKYNFIVSFKDSIKFNFISN